MIRSLFTAVAAVVVSVSVQAAEYAFILPNPPGSGSEVVARSIATEYNKRTGNTLVLDFMPGGDHIIAAQKFKTQQRPTVVLGTSSMHLFNHVFKDSLPYSDADFNHVAYIGIIPTVWYVSATSKIKDGNDLLKALSERTALPVAVDALQSRSNVIAVQRYSPNGSKAEPITYKGPAQALVDVIGGHIEVGVSSITQSLLANAEAGKIRIIGTAGDYPIVVNGEKVQPIAKQLKAPQFNGSFFLSINNVGNSAELNTLKKDLFESLNSKFVKDALAEILVDVDGRDGKYATKIMEENRKNLQTVK